MQNRFLVPVIIATAFHALVFFGFNGSSDPTIREPDPPPSTVPPPVIAPIEADLDDPVISAEVRAESKPQRKGSEDVYRPQMDEPLAQPTGWEIKPEPIHPSSGLAIDKIDPRLLGSLDGDGEEWTDHPVISFKHLDNPPRTRSQIAPIYPAAAKASGLTGEVLVEFVVDEQGRVLHARVVKSSSSIFEAPTLKAVERWRFEPGKKTGRPVRFMMVAPVVFSLEN